jgi:hypothetical protein
MDLRNLTQVHFFCPLVNNVSHYIFALEIILLVLIANYDC